MIKHIFLFAFIALLLSSCSSQKFLQENETILSDVKVSSSSKKIKANNYREYIRQEPNAKWFNLLKVPLGIYCLSSSDSISGNKGFSKILRNIGEAPVIYDKTLTQSSQDNLKRAMISHGYLRASVDTVLTQKKHKTKVEYILHPGNKYYVQKVKYQFDSKNIHNVWSTDSAETLLYPGMTLDLNVLSAERKRIVEKLHNRGYYYINNDYISFDIDTIPSSTSSDVTLCFKRPAGTDTLYAYTPQRFRKINLYESLGEDDEQAPVCFYRNVYFHLSKKKKLNKRTYINNIKLSQDSLYRELDVQGTYNNLNALPVINYTNLKIYPVENSTSELDCDISVQHTKPHTIGLEVEGTNTAGDLGAALALTYSNRNLFKGAEQLSLRIRGAYEAITQLEGYSNQNYMEWSAEAKLRFPNLLIPFIDINRTRLMKASSEAQVMYDMQDRPEFHRRVLTWSWAYRWNSLKHKKWQHYLDLFSLNYIYMPWISDTFRKDYLEGDDPHYSVLRYSYENLFIMKTGYHFTYNSLHDSSNPTMGLYQKNGYQIKFGAELAGNFLYGMSKLFKNKLNENGDYQFLGIGYSQYAKFDFDYTTSRILNYRNSIAFHANFGIGIPYGNSSILPYEKRYFSGGANSVRGWGVRELGPGSYVGKDGKVDFVNQTGNLKLEFSVEWRTYLFWKLHGAFFIDAGNIWNTRSYEGLEDAKFDFSKFYKQIAVSYGLGIRLNLDYFIIRLDGGMKAINPGVPSGRLHYPISKPNFKRDFTFHFAVGLPF